MVFLKTHSITRMCPVVDDLWGHVGGKSITKPPSSLRSLSTAYQPTWAHQRVTESESDDESVEALTVRTPLQ